VTAVFGTGGSSLARFVEAGVLESAAVHLAELISRTVKGVEPEVLLAAALAARAPLFGHVCVVVQSVASTVVVDEANHPSFAELAWPEARHWAKLLTTSRAVRQSHQEPGEVVLPLVFDGTRLYLERYWRFEERIAQDLLARGASSGGISRQPAELEAILEELFSPDTREGREVDSWQVHAARTALEHRLAVIAGGPGTGKTRTIARLVAAAYSLALARGEQLEVALAAPTGKAAARMAAEVAGAGATLACREGVSDALGSTEAKTLHRLLGIGTAGTPRYDRVNRLPHDLVVIDETSMVSLPLMARLLDAVRPEATLVLVGDPFQLASVEAGAVLGEIVGPMALGAGFGPLASDVVMLEHNHRFGEAPQLAALANAIRRGELDAAIEILRAGSDEVSWVDLNSGDSEALALLQTRAAAKAVEVIKAAQESRGEEGLELAGELKVLCATRFGQLGVSGWTVAIEALAKREVPHLGIGTRRYVGRPVVVTSNDYLNSLFNGDVGLFVAGPSGPVAAFRDAAGELRELALSQLGEVDTWWATTIHKSQGSEFAEVIVSLPPAPSPILTRELLYTAVTRAKRHVTLVASEESVRAAIAHPVARASGLRPKLWPNRPEAVPRRGARRLREGIEQLRFEL
jgi:exodeoxyribonuclease V alpha subunit